MSSPSGPVVTVSPAAWTVTTSPVRPRPGAIFFPPTMVAVVRWRDVMVSMTGAARAANRPDG